MRPNHRVLSNRRRREGRRVNYFPHTTNPTTGNGWDLSSPVLTTGVADYDGNTLAFTMNDDNATSFEWLRYVATGGLNVSPTWTFQCRIKKDAVPASTRYPLLRMTFNNGDTADVKDLIFDTSDGTTSTQGTADSWGVESDGDWWLCWITGTEDGTNADVQIDFYPAVGGTTLNHSYVGTVTGSITVCDLMLYPAPYEGRPIGGMVHTSGTPQT